MDSGNIAVVVLLLVIVVLGGLVFMFGYPFLIWVAVIGSFAALGLLVFISLGDIGKKPSRS